MTYECSDVKLGFKNRLVDADADMMSDIISAFLAVEKAIICNQPIRHTVPTKQYIPCL